MTQIRTQFEDPAITLSHGDPEAQSVVNSEQAKAPEGAVEILEGTDELHGQWIDGEPNEELLEPDDQDDDAVYLEIESEIGEAPGPLRSGQTRSFVRVVKAP